MVDPMTELHLGDQLIQYDRDATIVAYSNMEYSSAEECGCSVCCNFLS